MIAYLDCFSGISGDMFLGALVDAGVPIEELTKELGRLPVKGYELAAREVRRSSLRATKVDVIIKDSGQQETGHRKFRDIKKIIESSSLPGPVRQKGLSIFRRLFEAEARVHGGRYDRVHLHELGAVDCIVDIFGTLIGLDMLEVDTVYSSPLNLGRGTIKTHHGLLPVPAPAAVELLKDTPVYASDISFELTTPTGAVLVSSLAGGFGPVPEMQISMTGTGAGTKDFREQPNVLRIFIGSRVDRGDGGISVIETNIDDMNPQVYEYVMDKLFKAGALDVFLTQIIMKKGRPGIKLTVLCTEDKKDDLINIILRETTSIGLRFYSAGRKTLPRSIKLVETKFGTVNVKVIQAGTKSRRISVEYEDCKRIAEKLDIPLAEVMKILNSL
ncbi:MAG: nickel pincer cofactor biosynthesis protein LarC [Deferribacteres bacterium]|nr:nickel pincer cofactor biosynthesis protein LarC [Deferribacteres bacterium]